MTCVQIIDHVEICALIMQRNEYGCTEYVDVTIPFHARLSGIASFLLMAEY